MSDLGKIIDGLSKSGFLSGMAGGLVSGSLAGAVTGSKKGKKMGKKALKLGALAAVGGIAWKAYQSYSNQGTNAGSAADANTAVTPRGTAGPTYSPTSLSEQHFAATIEQEMDRSQPMLILKAMIAAAYADGHMDDGERGRIFEQVDQLGLTGEEKGQLFDEMNRPMGLVQLVNAVPNPETGLEVYAASLLALDETQAESRAYLHQLATGLELPRELVGAVHQQAEQGKRVLIEG